MRVLFFGDMAGTGFGTVTMDLGRDLLALGEDVRFISLNQAKIAEPFASRTLSALSFEYAARLEVEQGNEPKDHLVNLLTEGTCELPMYNQQPWGVWKPEAVILLGDFAAARIFVGQGNDDARLKAFGSVPTYHYCPVEGVGLPPKWKELWDVIHPVAMSKFGQAQMAKVIGYEPPLVYHGVDSKTFHPVSEHEPVVITSVAKEPIKMTTKDECKRALAGWLLEQHKRERIGRHWIVRTDRHMPRKLYNVMLRALYPVLMRHPDWSLVIHCPSYDEGGYLWDTISKMPNSVQSQVFVTDYRNMPRDLLVTLYNAADIYCSTSAEGFGLTIAEALACGVPVVAADYSAVPEVVGRAGLCVGGGLIDNPYDHYWFTVDEAEYGKAVEFLMESRKQREKRGALGPQHIRSKFRWDTAAKRFRDVLHSSRVEVAA